jgi:hypothetical protein
MQGRHGILFYTVFLVIIILLGTFVLIALAMMLSMDQTVATGQKGAAFVLVENIILGSESVMVMLASMTDSVFTQFWNVIGNLLLPLSGCA